MACKRSPLRNSVYQVLLVLIAISASDKVASEEQVLKLVSGLYWSDLPNPIWYEAYAAAVIEILTPRLNNSELVFNNWYNCTSETSPYPSSCPTTYYLNQHIQRLQGDFENIHPGASDLGTSQRVFLEELIENENFCHVIQDHFPETYLNDTDYKWYLEQLKACLSDGVSGLQLVSNRTDFRYNPRTSFSRMEKAFYDKFYNKTSESTSGTAVTKLLASATLANSRNVLQSLVLGSFYAERLRWAMVDNHCGMKRLPSTVVGVNDLKELLDNITTAWNSNASPYELSIPPTMLAKYYEQPLTDCAHNNKTLIVRLLVPLVQAGSRNAKSDTPRFTLKTAKIAKFHIGNQVCQIRGIPDGARFVFDSLAQIAYKTECIPGHLCDVSPHTKAGQEHVCATSVFTNNVGGIQHNCEYSCKPAEATLLGKHHEFQIRRIGRGKIVVAGNHIRANVTCPVSSAEVQVFHINFSSPTHGAVEFDFKCKCDLILESHHHLGSSVALPAMLSQICRLSGNESIAEFVTVRRVYPWRYIDQMQIWNHFPNETELVDGSEVQVENFNEAIVAYAVQTNTNMDNNNPDEDKVTPPQPQHELDSNEAKALAAAVGAKSAEVAPAKASYHMVGFWILSGLLLVAVVGLIVVSAVMYKKLRWVQDQVALVAGYRVTYTRASEFDIQHKADGYADPLLCQ